MIKLLIGGSPCTHWSIAQKNNRETEPEGLGWELFKNYLIAKEKFEPDFFLYENNKSAAQPIKDQISQELGIDLMYINSALVSAQNRQRFYAFNWEVEQPEDRGILLKDILESKVDEQGYNLVEPICVAQRGRYTQSGNRSTKCEGGTEQFYEPRKDGKTNTLTTVQKDNLVAELIRIGSIGSNSQAHRVYSSEGKSVNLVANGGGQGAKTGLYACPLSDYVMKQLKKIVDKKGYIPEHFNLYNAAEITDKAPTQTAGCGQSTTSATVMSILPISCETAELSSEYWHGNDDSTLLGKIECANTSDNKGQPAQGTRIYVPNGKSICLDGDSRKYIIDQYFDNFVSTNKPLAIYTVKDGLITIKDKQYPVKLPDGFYIIRKLTPIECERLQTMPDNYTACVSNSQRYKGLGNGWTAEVIIHILNGALKDAPRDEEIVALSMYDGIGTGRYCLDKMGFTNVKYYAYEIDKYAKQIAMSNYPDIIQCGDAFQLRNNDWSLTSQ